MAKLKRKFISSIEEWSQKTPLSLLGQTGSGKTQCVLDYLRKKNLNSAVLVSVDSIAAYQELDIGSAKPLGKARSDFSWLGLDLLPPSEKVTAAIFRNDIKEKLRTLEQPIVFVGGTLFYERYLLEGPAPGTASDADFIRDLAKSGAENVYARMIAEDSRWQVKIHIKDTFRLYRFADLVLRQKLSFDQIAQGGEALYPEIETLILDIDVAQQDALLAQRIEKMFQAGWLEEVRALLEKYQASDPGLLTMGYDKIVEYLSKESMTCSELKERILIQHRQLGKLQRTWLRKLRVG